MRTVFFFRIYFESSIGVTSENDSAINHLEWFIDTLAVKSGWVYIIDMKRSALSALNLNLTFLLIYLNSTRPAP